MHHDADPHEPAPQFVAPSPGDVISGKYRIEEVVGRGGMSIVYRATHLELDQEVAIKVLAPLALSLPEYVVRLKREARAVSRIRSEHVVRVYDIGEIPESKLPFLVMEHLSGGDLAAVLARRGPLPVPAAIDCILQVCEALAEAHALGIVHRDLKPANLFLTESADGAPFVKVLDFGISRMPSRSALSPLTDPGVVLGTPSYMAPEQMEGTGPLDARSDLWALGAILYELLVGNPPYRGDSLTQIFVRIMRSKPPRPSFVRTDVPHEIDGIIARCLAIDPANRYQTVADLAWALSTLGSPRARDSAERISRVLERRSGSPDSLDAPVLPPRRVAPPARYGAASLVGLSFVSLIVGASLGFGALSVRAPAAASPAAPPERPEREDLLSVVPGPVRAPSPPRATTDAGVVADGSRLKE